MAIAAYAAAIGLALLRAFGLGRVGALRLGAHWAMLDFYANQYFPARALRDGVNPHDASWLLRQYPTPHGYMPYAPLNLVLHLPFTYLPPVAAGVVYFAVCAFSAWGQAYLALRLAKLSATSGRALLVAAALLISRPGQWTLLLGQTGFLLSLVVYWALAETPASDLRQAAQVCLGFVKVTFGVPLAWLLWSSGRRRAVVSGVGLAIVLNAPLLALFVQWQGGLSRFVDALLLGYSAWQDAPQTSLHRIDITSFVSRFLGMPAPPTVQLLLNGGLLLLAGVMVHRLAREREQAARDLIVGIFCISICLFGYHLGYDLVVLLAPAVVVAVRGVPSSSSRALRVVVLVLFLVPGLNYAASEAGILALRPSHGLWLVVTSVNGFCLCLLLAEYMWLALRYPLAPTLARPARPWSR